MHLMKWLNILDIFKNYYFTVWLQNTHMQIFWGKKGDQGFQSSSYSIFFSPSVPARPSRQWCASQEFSLASEHQNAATLCGSCDKFCLHSYRDWGPHAFCNLLFLWSTNLYLTFTYLCQTCLCASSLQLFQQNVLPWLLLSQSMEIEMIETNKKFVGFGSGPQFFQNTLPRGSMPIDKGLDNLGVFHCKADPL